MCVSPHRSDGEGQDGHHPVPQADQLPQLALLLPAVASLRQQAGHINQDAQGKKHRLDHLQGGAAEGEISEQLQKEEDRELRWRRSKRRAEVQPL